LVVRDIQGPWSHGLWMKDSHRQISDSWYLLQIVLKDVRMWHPKT
jgi:hypothetical protein